MRRLLLVLVVIVVLLVLPGRAAASAWERPVDGRVLRVFNVGPDRFAAGQHRGVDLAAPVGGRVRSACGGRVSFAGRVPRGGLTVSVRCGRLVATYQHLGAASVSRGQVVVPGAGIGTVGSGRAPSPHVHLGVRDRATGAYLDPLSLLQGSPRALPPPVPVRRRPLPLGPAPVPRRPLPLGPAPVARRPVRVGPATAALPAGPVELHALPAAGADRLPWPVWIGLALVVLGLPLRGGIVAARRRRRCGRAVRAGRHRRDVEAFRARRVRGSSGSLELHR